MNNDEPPARPVQLLATIWVHPDENGYRHPTLQIHHPPLLARLVGTDVLRIHQPAAPADGDPLEYLAKALTGPVQPVPHDIPVKLYETEPDGFLVMVPDGRPTPVG